MASSNPATLVIGTTRTITGTFTTTTRQSCNQRIPTTMRASRTDKKQNRTDKDQGRTDTRQMNRTDKNRDRTIITTDRLPKSSA